MKVKGYLLIDESKGTDPMITDRMIAELSDDLWPQQVAEASMAAGVERRELVGGCWRLMHTSAGPEEQGRWWL